MLRSARPSIRPVRATGYSTVTLVNEAVMLGVDCDGFDVRADRVRLRFDFPETAPDAESVQRAIVEMIDMGRDARTP